MEFTSEKMQMDLLPMNTNHPKASIYSQLSHLEPVLELKALVKGEFGS